MAWDIYGNNLIEGFCEVHPHVNEYYPCRICCDEIQKEEDRRREYNQQKADYEKEMVQEYYKEMELHEIEKLQSDKAELLEALEIFFPMFTELDSEFGIENPHPRKWTETEIATVQKLLT